MRTSRWAFTLVELLIVIIIIAVLAAIAIPKAADAVNRNRDSVNAEQIRLLTQAIDRFHTDTDAYPASLDDLLLNTSAPPSTGVDKDGNDRAIQAANFHGPYLDHAMVDPYHGNEYGYMTTPPNVGDVSVNEAGDGGVGHSGGTGLGSG